MGPMWGGDDRLRPGYRAGGGRSGWVQERDGGGDAKRLDPDQPRQGKRTCELPRPCACTSASPRLASWRAAAGIGEDEFPNSLGRRSNSCRL